jgi:hypothetical protein
MFDPFTGSGTSQVEAFVRGIPSLGLDIDPLACFIARVKTTPLDPLLLERRFELLEKRLRHVARPEYVQERLTGDDISEDYYARLARSTWIPPIPDIGHWFRRHVTIDLARILEVIDTARLSQAERDFFYVSFAGVIRRVSNADPSPVSGLEVTRVQAAKNKGRNINAVNEVIAKTRRDIEGMRSLWKATRGLPKGCAARVHQGDVLAMPSLLSENGGHSSHYRLIVTSPPYCTAVEYSRRHKLEMYWLSLITDQDEHVRLTNSYIGRRRARSVDWNESAEFSGVLDLERRVRQVGYRDPVRERALRHYFWSMDKALRHIRDAIHKRGTFVCMIGDSVCAGIRIPTADYIETLAKAHFRVVNRFAYAIRNHYMQYDLRGGGIQRETVLVLQPRVAR